MMALLGRLAGPRCSSWRCLGVILRRTHSQTFTPVQRDGARQVARGGRLLTGYSHAQSRGQHTEGADPVEVDVKRLEGEDDGIVEVLMCRHKARNALGHVFLSQMKELVSTLSGDSVVRVIVFRSLVPGVFCAGADLKERALMNNSESDLFVHGLRSLMTQIASLPMPTIAAIDGFALGGGLELALACDLRTAAYSAQMGLIETTRGLLPGAGGSQRLPRVVGITRAKELIFTGKRVGGQTALEMGLINRAVEQNQTGDAAYREALCLAREILPQASVVPYFFHSSSDARSWQGQSGSHVKKWTTDSTTHTHSETHACVAVPVSD
ncbi:enoyl-CoA hydratase domain-containing protein 2, mitochondrial isoform X2 [Mastacembelus armatus]|uniref:Enoyl CoA hydratase domain containing 2 n=1 Tax=Mastacembelus armatus TaxID=205130 RepID=A0A3Q3MKQ0_9TELE|nr:enoyl-CoA hydratase domain-containing protein 2, mitochondrial isoform X2 [Mastacembelus armatus]